MWEPNSGKCKIKKNINPVSKPGIVDYTLISALCSSDLSLFHCISSLNHFHPFPQRGDLRQEDLCKETEKLKQINQTIFFSRLFIVIVLDALKTWLSNSRKIKSTNSYMTMPSQSNDNGHWLESIMYYIQLGNPLLTCLLRERIAFCIDKGARIWQKVVPQVLFVPLHQCSLMGEPHIKMSKR